VKTGRPLRGFTLIELMMVVAMIGILSSIAIPELRTSSLRAKSAERRTIINAIAKVVTDVTLTQNGVPGHTLSGADNPPLPLSTAKRLFVPTMVGWNQLPLAIDGATYYSYSFTVSDHMGLSTTTLDINAQGDLDGDGTPSAKLVSYTGLGNAFYEETETPESGAEDQGTF
jgi:prepilin-type N-terminal cleavage/methylation domain-containing protein